MKKTQETTLRTITGNSETISYKLIRKPVKNVNMRIKPDGRILLSANSKVPLKFIDEFVIGNEERIFNILEQYKKIAENKKTQEINPIFVDRPIVVVFKEILNDMYQLFGEYNIPYPTLKIRKMKARWGSCRPVEQVVTLNRNLIYYRREAIEYVVVHELAHFIQPNHSKAFYQVVEHVMPDYKERKAMLKMEE